MRTFSHLLKKFNSENQVKAVNELKSKFYFENSNIAGQLTNEVASVRIKNIQIHPTAEKNLLKKMGITKDKVRGITKETLNKFQKLQAIEI